jgi:cold shock CspA family protein
MEGTMLWFNPAKRHGFVRADDGERLRVEHDGLAMGQSLGDRCRGTRVSFDRVDHHAEPLAVNVAAVPIFAERRARSRGRR